MWQTINEVIGKNKSSALNEVNPNKLNDFFANIGQYRPQLIHNSHYTNDNIFLTKTISESLFLSLTSTEEVISVYYHLNSNAAVGFDNISVKLLKNYITILLHLI